ncbi:MAG: cupredoxin domain-containing protein [Actinobacteria bacterium]|nr:cupredoxin domain-containing protein [Actinomycetota bacterium]
MKLLGCVVGCLVLSTVGSGCSASSGKTAGNTVQMTGARRFEPAAVTVDKGDTVTFTNSTDEPHSVTAYEGGIPADARYFSSGDFSSEDQARDNVTESLIETDGSFQVTLTKPGVYEYFCIPHESQGMKGKIVVEG